MRAEVEAAIDSHRRSGREFEAGGLRSFVLERGSGEPVVLMHGLPVSSFVYRKLAPLLADKGLRAVAFDLPGLGLAERPGEFDYSWSGLARWTGEAIEALEVERCHLVVHDLGGPVGFEWAIGHPERVLSLTVMNTWGWVEGFRRIWTMQLLAIPAIGEAWFAAARPPVARWLFYRQGIADRSATPSHEVDAHLALARLGDGGRALLKIVRGFELTAEKEQLFRDGLRDARHPSQIVWGERDSAFPESHRLALQEILGIERPILLPARHFLQEDHAQAVAESIAELARPRA
jgi:pimeloyl-ACP methyl ester carboxylesterase